MTSSRLHQDFIRTTSRLYMDFNQTLARLLSNFIRTSLGHNTNFILTSSRLQLLTKLELGTTPAPACLHISEYSEHKAVQNTFVYAIPIFSSTLGKLRIFPKYIRFFSKECGLGRRKLRLPRSLNRLGAATYGAQEVWGKKFKNWKNPVCRQRQNEIYT